MSPRACFVCASLILVQCAPARRPVRVAPSGPSAPEPEPITSASPSAEPIAIEAAPPAPEDPLARAQHFAPESGLSSLEPATAWPPYVRTNRVHAPRSADVLVEPDGTVRIAASFTAGDPRQLTAPCAKTVALSWRAGALTVDAVLPLRCGAHGIASVRWVSHEAARYLSIVGPEDDHEELTRVVPTVAPAPLPPVGVLAYRERAGTLFVLGYEEHRLEEPNDVLVFMRLDGAAWRTVGERRIARLPASVLGGGEPGHAVTGEFRGEMVGAREVYAWESTRTRERSDDDYATTDVVSRRFVALSEGGRFRRTYAGPQVDEDREIRGLEVASVRGEPWLLVHTGTSEGDNRVHSYAPRGRALVTAAPEFAVPATVRAMQPLGDSPPQFLMHLAGTFAVYELGANGAWAAQGAPQLTGESCCTRMPFVRAARGPDGDLWLVHATRDAPLGYESSDARVRLYRWHQGAWSAVAAFYSHPQ